MVRPTTKQCQQWVDSGHFVGMNPQVRRMRAIKVTKNAVDQPIRMMPLIPSIAETNRHLSAIAASL